MHIYLELSCEWVPSTLLPLVMALFTDNGLGPLTFLRLGLSFVATWCVCVVCVSSCIPA